MNTARFELLTKSAGGRFKMTCLLQKRMQEILRGSPKLIDDEIESPFEIVLREAETGRVQLLTPPSAERVPEPPEALVS